MKVLYLITKSNYGGAQKYVFELAFAAKEAGHEVAVACGGTGEKGAGAGKLKDRLESAGIRTIPIAAFMRDMSLIRDLKAFFEVHRLLRRERPDVLHVTSSKAGGIGAAAGRLARVPRIIFTSHGLTMDESWRPCWQRLLIALGTWCTMRLAHHSIMISTETYERVRRMPGMSKRVSLIFNGLEPFPLEPKDSARRHIAPDVPPEAVWIGGIGELHQNKNWQAAVKALSELPAHVHLIIIGEGEEAGPLQDLAQRLDVANRLHLPGYVADAAHQLPAFDIFLLVSLKEGLPYVLLEAGQARLPVIASDLPGIRDIVTQNENGLLISPTPDAIARAVETLLDSPGLRSEFGDTLNSTVSNTFSMEKMVRETFVLYSAKMLRASK